MARQFATLELMVGGTDSTMDVIMVGAIWMLCSERASPWMLCSQTALCSVLSTALAAAPAGRQAQAVA